jgi:histidinol-phosphate aminotransferase
MNWSNLLAPPLRALAPYRPGMTEEKLREERGLREIYKFSSNEAPFPPSPHALSAMQEALAQSNRYPDAQALVSRLSQALRVPQGSIVLGNGSIDVIGALVRAFVAPEHNVVLSEYGYCAYPAFVTETGAAIRIAASGPHFGHDVQQLLARVDARTRMLIVDSPTNLSGHSLSADALRHLVNGLPRDVLLVLDEAYVEFTDGDAPRDTEQLPLRYPNVIVTRTFSKAYGLAGLRIGYGIAAAGLIECLNRIRPPFPVSRVALAGARAALDDTPYLERIVESTRRGRRKLADELPTLGYPVCGGTANFALADFGSQARSIYEGLLARGFITRPMSAYALPNHIRISVGAPHEIDKLLAALISLRNGAPADSAIGVLA